MILHTFHAKSDVERLYYIEFEWRSGTNKLLGVCERWGNHFWFVICEDYSLDLLLQGISVTGVIEYEETVTVNMNSKHLKNVKLNSWKEKRLHSQFLREIPETKQHM